MVPRRPICGIYPRLRKPRRLGGQLKSNVKGLAPLATPQKPGYMGAWRWKDVADLALVPRRSTLFQDLVGLGRRRTCLSGFRSDQSPLTEQHGALLYKMPCRSAQSPRIFPSSHYTSLIMSVPPAINHFDIDVKHDSPGEFIENASTPEDLESLNVDIKKLVRKV